MRILAVAITYNPDVVLLSNVLRSVSPQVQEIILVDNGSANAEDIRRLGPEVGAQVLQNKENIGIAAAQNQGIAHARSAGFSHVLLLDQDTILAPGMVADLAENLSNMEAGQGGIAAIGPAYYELNSQKQTKAYLARGLFLTRLSLENMTLPVASDFIIASGSLIPLAVLDRVGGFKEELFIDLVDVEWCFRARQAGYKSFLSPTAGVDHRLGSGTVSIGPRQVAIHVPIRNYYWVRNALWLARQPYTPLAWRLYFISRSLAFVSLYTTFANDRVMRLKLILRGIYDSLRAQLGKYS